ncbi:MAG: hypothetical protein CFE21_15660 [Bacteroidetes bacterium B1(2017)]|nr:MAG: hypothetical protein CFE21_15660 [Bacteroidetes bacterium B1(2017)]
MKTLVLNPTNEGKFYKKESLKTKLARFIGEVILFLKVTYLTSVLILTCVCIIEVKHTYKIDIFPSIDTPFDNIYYSTGLPTLSN